MVGMLVFIILAGVVLYLVNTYVPMAAPIKNILNIVVVICVLLVVLNFFGLLDSANWNFPRRR